MAFAMNYWQITASRVQHNAPGQPASRPAGPKGNAPVQSQASFGLDGGLAGKKTSDAQVGAPEQQTSKQGGGMDSCLRFEELYTHPPEQWPTAGQPPGAPGGGGQVDKVTRMMQACPNLTMAQVKAILKVDRFE